MDNKEKSYLIMKNILVIAPHPDDETLGCGGTLLKHLKNNDKIFWIIATSMNTKDGWSENKKKVRDKEILSISKKYNFSKVFNLNYSPGKISDMNLSLIIEEFRRIFKDIKPNIIYAPYINDVHSDHKIISKATISSIKNFRSPTINKVMFYETISETNFNFGSTDNFNPNLFVDISNFLQKKINIMQIYKSEIKKHPFPRSKESLTAKAILYGSIIGVKYAEAFQIIYQKK